MFQKDESILVSLIAETVNDAILAYNISFFFVYLLATFCLEKGLNFK